MVSNKVVIQFKDGTILKGSTSDFLPTKSRFHLNSLDGTVKELDHVQTPNKMNEYRTEL